MSLQNSKEQISKDQEAKAIPQESAGETKEVNLKWLGEAQKFVLTVLANSSENRLLLSGITRKYKKEKPKLKNHYNAMYSACAGLEERNAIQRIVDENSNISFQSIVDLSEYVVKPKSAKSAGFKQIEEKIFNELNAKKLKPVSIEERAIAESWPFAKAAATILSKVEYILFPYEENDTLRARKAVDFSTVLLRFLLKNDPSTIEVISSEVLNSVERVLEPYIKNDQLRREKALPLAISLLECDNEIGLDFLSKES